MLFAGTSVLIACAPTVRPPEPPPEPVGPGQYAPTKAGKPQAAGRQVVVGELCPQAAAGRPAVAPLMMKQLDWIDESDQVAAMVERGRVPRFNVLGTDGKSAGVFDTIGVADVGMKTSVAAGTYTGASPCSADAGASSATTTATTTRSDTPACAAAMLGCGLAVGELARPDDPVETPRFATSGACLMNDSLAIDIDGDGAAEVFPLAGVLDPVRAPAQEWLAGPAVGTQCTPSFTTYDVKLTRPPEPGKTTDPKATVTLDVLGVLDLDGDGRNEVVLALRFPTVRTIVVYSAKSTFTRLELVGETESFPR
jgi:hypothetical protein